jgi:hypothetical protein
MSIDLVQNAIQLINEAKDVSRTFVGPVNDEQIAEFEKQLGIETDPGYRLFLSNFGAGSFGFLEIMGIVPAGSRVECDPRDAVYVTKKFRNHKESPMAQDLYVIGSVGDGCEWVLKSQPCTNNEVTVSPVYSWDIGVDYTQHDLFAEYASFGDFFLEQVKEAISFARD